MSKANRRISTLAYGGAYSAVRLDQLSMPDGNTVFSTIQFNISPLELRQILHEFCLARKIYNDRCGVMVLSDPLEEMNVTWKA